MKIRPSIIIRRESKILFLQYDYPEGQIFAIPGGGTEKGETLIQTLERELMEELSLVVKVGSLAMVCEVNAFGNLPKTLHLIFEGMIDDQAIPALNAQHTTAKSFVWLDKHQLQEKQIYPNVGSVLQREQNLHPVNNYLGLLPDRNWA